MDSHGLLHKIIITFTAILAVALISLALSLSLWFKFNYFTEKRTIFNQVGTLANNLIINYINDKDENGYKKIEKIISNKNNPIGGDIIITDKEGNILWVSNKELMNKETKINFNEKDVKKLSNGENVEYINSNYTLICPISENNNFFGMTIITSPLSVINERLHKMYIMIWLSAFIAMIFASVVLPVFVKRKILNPLKEINDAARKFAQGEVQRRVCIKYNDEIGELANSFNIMAESLGKVEQNRRNFISNVSHELRSPITSIKGFIAGIIDGIIPEDKEKEYLERVYNEIERLTRLVNDLLDLSAIESGKLKFNLKKLDINELVRRSIINNERRIKDKGIDLQVVLKNEKCYVNADEDKIMQVITNLLDNAIKYCGQYGKIKISLYTKGNKVFIEFYNNGPSMTDEELIHIWDRFYKSDKARTNKISTGLGLPIVKMILMQQGEEIWAKNDKEKGVKFTFSLTKYK